MQPYKKVTKEDGIGEALEPRSRASNTPSPMYPTRGASPGDAPLSINTTKTGRLRRTGYIHFSVGNGLYMC